MKVLELVPIIREEKVQYETCRAQPSSDPNMCLFGSNDRYGYILLDFLNAGVVILLMLKDKLVFLLVFMFRVWAHLYTLVCTEESCNETYECDDNSCDKQEDIDVSGWTVAELRQELKKCGLSAVGKKRDLIARIVAYYKGR
jgi:hypothetical protein